MNEEEIIINLLNVKGQEYKKHKPEELIRKSKIPTEKFINTIKKLYEEGIVYIDKNNLISLFPPHLIFGKIRIKNNNGTIKYKNKKYRLKKTNRYGLLNEDTIIAQLTNTTEYEMEVVSFEKLVKREEGIVVGEVQEKNGEKYIIDINNTITGIINVSSEELKKHVNGDRLLIKIGIEKINGEFTGNIVKLIGHKDDPDLFVNSLLSKHGLKTGFSEEAIKEAKEANERGITPEDLEGRIDLRSFPNISIDPITCKDRDDSFFIQFLPNNHKKIYINIVDTTHWVHPGTAMWKDAEEKCFSAYVYNTCEPLFPHTFSNGIGSINENEDRLTESLYIEFDENDEIVDFNLVPSIVHTKKNCNYDDVNKLLEENIVVKGYEDIKDDILAMNKIAEKYYDEMIERGFLDFSTPEPEYIFDDQGEMINIVDRKTGKAQKMVEVYMLLADELITDLVFLPAPYRNHPTPDKNIIKHIVNDLKELGIKVKIYKSIPISLQIQSILKQVKGKPYERIVSEIIIKDMKKAFYSPHNIGHFGLALIKYLQWTSPDRRFPDTILHQIIKIQRRIIYENLTESEYQKLYEEIYQYLDEICRIISNREEKIKIVEKESHTLAVQKIGNENKNIINAQITYLNSKFILVKTNDGQEGYLDVNGLYRFNQKTRSYIHKKLKFSLQLGSLIKVRIKNISADDNLIFDIPKSEAKKLSLTLR